LLEIERSSRYILILADEDTKECFKLKVLAQVKRGANAGTTNDDCMDNNPNDADWDTKMGKYQSTEVDGNMTHDKANKGDDCDVDPAQKHNAARKLSKCSSTRVERTPRGESGQRKASPGPGPRRLRY